MTKSRAHSLPLSLPLCKIFVIRCSVNMHLRDCISVFPGRVAIPHVPPRAISIIRALGTGRSSTRDTDQRLYSRLANAFRLCGREDLVERVSVLVERRETSLSTGGPSREVHVLDCTRSCIQYSSDRTAALASGTR